MTTTKSDLVNAVAEANGFPTEAAEPSKKIGRTTCQYGFAVAVALLGYLFLSMLTAWVGPGLPPYITFYPAVMAVALLAGFGPGVLATIVLGAIAAYLVLPPIGEWSIFSPVDRVGLALFTCMGLFMSTVARLYRRNRDKAAAYDREKNLRKMRQEKGFLANLLEAAEQPFAIGYPDGRLGLLNRSYEQLTGYTAAELRSIDWSALLTPPEWRDHERQKLAELQRTGQPVRYEKEYLRKDGTRVPVELFVNLSRDAAGRPEFYYAFITDITERKKAEEALEQTRNTLAEAQKIAHMGSFEYVAATRTTVWSEEEYRIYGLDPAGPSPTYEVMLAKCIHPDDAALLHGTFTKAMQSGSIYELEHRIVRSDGSLRWVYDRAHPYFDENRNLLRYVGATLDITARKVAEGALRASEELNRRTLQALPAHIAVLDREGRIIATNQAWEEFAAQNEAAGKPSVAVGASYIEVFRHATADNDESAAEALAGIEAVMTGRQAQFTMEYPCHGPQEKRWFYMTVAPLGTPGESGVVVTHLNITARKQAEEELRQLNLILEQRVAERTFELARTVEALQGEIGERVRAEEELKLANEQLSQRADQLRRLAGELTAVEQAERKRLSRILHDGLQQHLASVKIQIGGLTEQIDNEDLKQSIEEIEQILGEAMSMSRSLSAELSPPILYEGGLSKGLEWLIRWMREKHRFRVDLSLEAVPELSEDVKMLVFESVRELLFNAFKHAQASRAQVRLELVRKGEIRVTVSDEGAGFDPSRLMPAGDGGGFGLFSIRERIGLIGGRLEIDSAPGRGSRVALTVPHCQADAASSTKNGACASVILPPPIGAAKDQETTIRVLLVDDHELFRNGIARLLKNEPGLEIVAEAKDGQQAIEFAQEHTPNVILMDIGLPGINGIEATRVIHERHPEISIIGLSMYNDPEKVRDMLAAGATDYRTKGCTRAELVAAIREGLRLRKPTPK